MSLPPGSVIGILGGGQLGRMTALAAARLGYRVHVLAPDLDGPGAQVTNCSTLSSYEDQAALAAFAAVVDVVTFEFENVPLPAVAFLAERVPVRPGSRALEACQDRLAEKRFASDRGIAVAPHHPVDGPADLAPALAATGLPAILKTRRLGYDGKGQARIGTAAEAGIAWDRLGGTPSVLEGVVPFERELSVIVARGADGQTACYPPVENRHVDGILAETLAPASLPSGTARQAEAIAVRLAEGLDLVGLLAVELFLLPDGRLLVNELAPRPHNSGHWTLDACAVSQFEQLVRAVCGLPLGPTEPLAAAVMTNLLGDDVLGWRDLLAEPGARLHLYGKAEARPGRKMGHVTRLTQLPAVPG